MRESREEEERSEIRALEPQVGENGTHTGAGNITSHQLREYEVKKLRSPTCSRPKNGIFSHHIHATDGK